MAPIPQPPARDPTLDAADAAIEAVKVITRDEALAFGLPRYFTGTCCKHGHISERYTKTRICVECCRIHNKSKNGTRSDYNREWKQKNKERHSELNRISRNRNPQVARDRAKRYAKLNPHVSRVCGQNRRAREMCAKGKHTLEDINRLMMMQKHKCANCKKNIKARFHVDHIIPLALGGSNHKYNLQLLCPECNQAKHALDPIKWANRNGRLL
jgi:5-methylcytosine-specific restriction endonuclease McrA